MNTREITTDVRLTEEQRLDWLFSIGFQTYTPRNMLPVSD